MTYSGLADEVAAPAGAALASIERQTQLGRTLSVSYGQVANRIVSDIQVRGSSGSGPWANVRDAVWDIGSTASAIDLGLARELGLEQVDESAIATMAGTVEAAQFFVEVRIGSGMAVGPLRVNGIDLSGRPDGMRALLGMDVITKGRLTVETAGGVTRMEFSLPD